MDRRTLLSLVAAGVTGVAGCGSPAVDTSTPNPTTESNRTNRTETQLAEPRVERTLTLWNPTSKPVFTTAVGIRDDRDVFFENRDLLPGERARTTVAVPLGDISVLVETDTGVRAQTTWVVESDLDGLEVVIGRDETEFWRAASCDSRDGCPLALGGGVETESPVELPLVGDGLSRWYAPAGVVVENPGPETTVRLSIDLRNTTLVDRKYRLPGETRLSVPVTYRTGRYRVGVETDERVVETAWFVPDEPTKYVDVTSGTTGCGPANSTLTVANRDDGAHRLSLRVVSATEQTVRSDGETGPFERVFDLEPGESRELVPVGESGPYRVSASLETGARVSGTWWSCPPRGPASVVIDATGSPSLTAAGPQPG
ncbi:hypothetical protein C440_04278 [Haloferax mucosum ATCC BAA-1512]|uniref:Ig-like domain-containing protein n=1 Tax=Haloferax mucosum ATCC BAA-1512 TaxID=662479 RepID=M0IM86_9EURY|nr:hypothetical protein [Haloferax mucosum]ELZ96963.1 hypothetical protein C440_04278 [Haloferax mucosum ATCC BAA-1512]